MEDSHTISLPWGQEPIQLTLPARWRVRGILEPRALPPVSDLAEEVWRALAAPVGSPRLDELAQRDMRIAVVMDDSSRPTPMPLILPLVLAELERAGVSHSQITLVPAIGLHRAMDAEEINRRAGVDGLQYENPNCDDLQTMKNLGITRRGTPIWVNRIVAEADLVISIGCIEPHIIASFGGGYKNLVPGVAGRLTVAHNHSLNCTPQTFNMVGQPIDQNPMRLDLEEAASKVKGKVFIVNVILNYAQELVAVVAGDPVLAHRAGVQCSASLYGVPVTAPADLVITASHPMDSDLRQGVKALANTVRAVKPGGMIITLVKAEEGVGVFGLANRKLPVGKGMLRRLAPLLVRFVPRLKLNGIGEEDRFFLYFALQAMCRARMIMYAPTIPAVTQENLPFVDFVSSPQEAMLAAQERFPGAADVLVFPHGGITYPQMGVR